MSRRTDTAFLPAALEVQETPPSPIGRAMIWAIVALFTLGTAWATVSDVDIVAVAPGRIIPSGHSKTVQPLEIATVVSIGVVEGQRVRAGDIVIQLDPSSARADVDRLTQEHLTAMQDVSRFRRLSGWLQRDRPPGWDIGQSSDDMLLQRLWREFEDRLNVLERENDRKVAEKRSARRQVDKLESVLPIVTQRATDHRGLVEQKLLPKPQYLQAEQERLEIYHDLRARQAEVEKLDAGIRELGARIDFTRSEFHREVVERLHDAERRQAAAEQELIKADARLKALTITAPVDGFVQQLAIHNIGAIVTPAQQLMVIVPQGEPLEVEADLANNDIGFVDIGQRAAIKIDAFPYTKYGAIIGEVVDISNDAVADDQGGLIYRMRVKMHRSEIQINGRPVPLSPGMNVSVESRTGTRRLIEYFLTPLLQYAGESMRER